MTSLLFRVHDPYAALARTLVRITEEAMDARELRKRRRRRFDSE